jgi:TetR/AcrR family acrAB operon transcriptional repressor
MSTTRAGKAVVLKVPFENPVSSLPETAQKILVAASRLLMDGGYDSVTLEKVAAEAGVNKASIRYNFGNKAGLVGALVDFTLHEEFEQDLAALSSTPHKDLVHRLIDGKRHILETTDNFRGFFDILPHALRDEDLRRRIAACYPWWAEQNLALLELQGSDAEARPEVLRGLGRLLSAVADGLSVQAALDPDGFDLDEPLKALEFLLDRALPDLDRLAAEAGES